MTRNKLSKSVRQYIRKEKSRLRKETPNLEDRKKLVTELYQRCLPKKKKTA
jgi:hypothetical protein